MQVQQARAGCNWIWNPIIECINFCEVEEGLMPLALEISQCGTVRGRLL